MKAAKQRLIGDFAKADWQTDSEDRLNVCFGIEAGIRFGMPTRFFVADFFFADFLWNDSRLNFEGIPDLEGIQTFLRRVRIDPQFCASIPPPHRSSESDPLERCGWGIKLVGRGGMGHVVVAPKSLRSIAGCWSGGRQIRRHLRQRKAFPAEGSLPLAGLIAVASVTGAESAAVEPPAGDRRCADRPAASC